MFKTRSKVHCPKCGNTMSGPLWKGSSCYNDHGRNGCVGEHLHYTCPCGYSIGKPTNDSRKPGDWKEP